MKKYDLIATGDGNFSFTEFAVHRDSMYATLKILELMSFYQVKLSEIIASIPSFYYHSFKIECSQALKGKMMRMFLEDAQDKKLSTVDGVKIWFDKDDWILMIPDQYNDHLNLYIQAKDEEHGEKLLAEYGVKIQEWLKS
jgi:mannose-1-phosphate guanylyltransferase/phosphomannomutase